MKKRVLALALAGCLLFGGVGCQGEAGEIYKPGHGREQRLSRGGPGERGRAVRGN